MRILLLTGIGEIGRQKLSRIIIFFAKGRGGLMDASAEITNLLKAWSTAGGAVDGPAAYEE
jgi:hypothetical protein